MEWTHSAYSVIGNSELTHSEIKEKTTSKASYKMIVCINQGAGCKYHMAIYGEQSRISVSLSMRVVLDYATVWEFRLKRDTYLSDVLLGSSQIECAMCIEAKPFLSSIQV